MSISIYLHLLQSNLEFNSLSAYSATSPQAIFKDPFRGGNNILVSLML